MTGLLGRLGQRLGQGRVDQHGLDDVVSPEAAGHGHRQHRDELGGVPAHDGAAQHDAGGRDR